MDQMYIKLKSQSLARRGILPNHQGHISTIESNISGEFTGWQGDTIFKLDNGQIWQQESYDYHYHYAYHPRVIIFQDSGRYKMNVEGVDKTIFVRQLR